MVFSPGQRVRIKDSVAGMVGSERLAGMIVIIQSVVVLSFGRAYLVRINGIDFIFKPHEVEQA